nr:ribonuclease H-like domain-containing protein [Tanacetum cinerariifolium]
EYLENSSNAITPDLPTEEPDNSLSMGDEHLSTLSKTESDEVIKSSVDDLVPIPSESEGISDDTGDVPFCDNSPPLDVLNDHFKIFSDFNDDCTSSDDDSSEDIDYVEASPPDSELVSLEKVKDDILYEKLLNINLLIAKIEALNNNPTPDCVLKSPSLFPIPVKDSDSFFEKSDTSLSYSDNSLPKFETFSDHTKETSSGSTTTHADNSLPEYDLFLFEIEPDQDELTSIVMEDIWDSYSDNDDYDPYDDDTYENHNLSEHVQSICDDLDITVRLTVSHPNRAQVLITIIGDLKINNDITLYDVLVVPEYTFSLLFVHKLSRDGKLFVGFDESNCYIQDLKSNMTVGIGKQYNGLYLFDIDNAWRVSSNDDDTELSSDDQGNDDSGATSMDENHNTHPEGTIPNETDFVNDFYENSEFNSEVEDFPVNTVRRPSRQTRLPTSLNDFVVEGKVNCGVERV